MRALWLVALLLVTVCIDFGHGFHSYQQSDAIVPVLVSIQHWTPFYWGQDRFGMLVPALALPVHHPLANLLLQNGIDILCLILSFFALARCVAQRDWIVVGAVGCTVWLASTTAATRFDMLAAHQPYSVATALGVAGLLLLKRSRAGGAACIALATWVNPAIAFSLGPCALLRAGSIRNAVPALVVIAAATVGSMALSDASTYHTTNWLLTSPETWPGAWTALADNAWRDFNARGWLTVIGVGAACGASMAFYRGRFWRYAAAVAPCATGAVASFLVAGTLEWSRINVYTSRYAIQAALFAQAALVALCVLPVLARLPRGAKPLLRACSLVGLVAVATCVCGRPSLTQVRADIDKQCGARTADIIASRCTHVTGDYTVMYPAVFHANLVLYETCVNRVVWGMGERDQPTRCLWAPGAPRYVYNMHDATIADTVR